MNTPKIHDAVNGRLAVVPEIKKSAALSLARFTHAALRVTPRATT
jgi:hypothetical protein